MGERVTMVMAATFVGVVGWALIPLLQDATQSATMSLVTVLS
jgi:hypothetical protein